MAMEFAGGEFRFGHSVLIKRKRSKRRRPSPFFAAASVAPVDITSSYSGGGDDCLSGSNCFSIDHYSPSISSDLSEITEEEEEAANCLLMLAKGVYPSEEIRQIGRRSTDNFCGRRFSEMATGTDITAAGKDDYVVYECKTCYRTFPSFQALGGHRTSHNKKLKFAPEEITERSLALLPPLVNADDDELEKSRINTKFILAALPLQMISGNGKAKLHRCSMCSAEFFSGKALGGHMTRHRTTMITPPTPAMNASTSSSIITNFDSIEDIVENRSKWLSVDLNFPAPEDDHRDFNSELGSTSGHFVLSTSDWLLRRKRK